MSGGLSALSDEELMRQLGQAPTGSAAPSSALSGLSDDEIMRQLGMSRGGSSSAPSKPNPFDQGGAASFDERFGSGAMARAPDTSNPMYEGLRAKADEQLVGKPGAANAAAAAVIRGSNALGLNIPRNLGALAASAPLVGNGRSLSQNFELAREQEEALSRQYPKTALAGEVAGIVGGAVALPGLGGAATVGGRVAKGALAGGGYGFASELAGTWDPYSALGAGGIGAVAGGAGTYAFEKLAPVATKGAKALYGMVSGGRPVVNEAGELTTTALAMLRREGVAPETLTPEVRAGIGRAVARKGESEAALREALGEEFGIPLSRGQATGDARAIEIERSALAGERGARAQTAGRDFTDRQAAAIRSAGDRFLDDAGRGVTLDNPMQAAEVVADQARERFGRFNLDAEAAQRAADEALAGLRSGGAGDRLDAGEAVARGIRGQAAASREGVRAAYGDLGTLPGEFSPDALSGSARRIEAAIGTDFPINGTVTPQAAQALADVRNMNRLLAKPDGSGATAQDIENFRKRLGVYHRGTGQNPTDRAAVGRIRSAFDEEMQGLAETGGFGPRAAQDGFPGLPGVAGASDGFPGSGGRPGAIGGDPGAETYRAAQRAMEEAAERGERISADEALSRVRGGQGGEPESLLAFISRNGGLPLDGEARAADLNRTYRPGSGTLARRDAPTWDQWRVRLAEERFMPYDEAMAASPRDVQDFVLDAIRSEQRGQPTYRLDESGLSRRAVERLSDENVAFNEGLAVAQREIQDELRAAGLRSQDIDLPTLRDASERWMRRQADSPGDAYEAAAIAREAAPSPRAAADDLIPFDGATVQPRGSALPVASPEGERYAELAQAARSKFQQHAATFGRQGAGDDVGSAVRKILDGNAEPVEVARMMYGPNTGLASRFADRFKPLLGEQDLAAYRHGYLDTILSGDPSPKALLSRIDGALKGDRRGLTYKVLSPQQASGLQSAKRAIEAAEQAKRDVPEWLTRLARSDFDPNRIASDLFGSGVPGARPGSAAEASTVKAFVGADSAEWNGLRRAAMFRLMMRPDGSEILPAKQLAERVREFTSGKGLPLARAMFDDEYIGKLRRFGQYVGRTAPPEGSAPSSGSIRNAKLAGKALDAVIAAGAFKVGGIPAAGTAYTTGLGTKMLQGLYHGSVARRSFEGGAPRVREVPPDMGRGRLGVGAGLYAGAGAE